eukprot:CAMPEP_0184995486 /NCGR_PEP_ID=MMETSP1098-20130426/52968_1 /TAXON_ID=89044 /ORGANISM="Spumella elongata, Strain CCAP 955/1" /LENGTH=39 /DNA_ID= /DNA_START= /DNA_END= /DNA_ORIENTATION=
MWVRFLPCAPNSWASTAGIMPLPLARTALPGLLEADSRA